MGGFHIFHKEDLRKIAPLWLEYTKQVHYAPRTLHVHGMHMDMDMDTAVLRCTMHGACMHVCMQVRAFGHSEPETFFRESIQLPPGTDEATTAVRRKQAHTLQQHLHLPSGTASPPFPGPTLPDPLQLSGPCGTAMCTSMLVKCAHVYHVYAQAMWHSEMYGYVFAAAQVGVTHKVRHDVSRCPSPHPPPLLSPPPHSHRRLV